MGNIWGSDGKLIGSVRDDGKGNSTTYDSHGQPNGSVRDNGTYDKNGHKISDTRDSGLTFWKK